MNPTIVEDPRRTLRAKGYEVSGPAPHRITLSISWREDPSELCFVLHHISQPVREFPPVKVGGRDAIAEMLASVGQLICSRAERTPRDPAERESWKIDAESFGDQLATLLLPPGLVDFIRSQPDGTLIQVTTNEEWVPWELLYDGAGFLGERFSLVRLPVVKTALRGRGVEEVPRTPLRALAIVSAELPDDAVAEVETHFPSAMRSEVKRSLTLSDLIDQSSGVNLLYIICHGLSNPTRLQIHEKAEPAVNLKVASARHPSWRLHRRSLVFANACNASAPESVLGEFVGFGRTFCEAGAGSFLGPLGTVPVTMARQFAREFYQALFGEAQQDVLVAFKLAKLRCRQDGWPTSIAYCLFLNPWMAATELARIRQENAG